MMGGATRLLRPRDAFGDAEFAGFDAGAQSSPGSLCFGGKNSVESHEKAGRDMDWRERITTNPDVCHGKACIKGTRVLVSVVLDNLAAGDTPEQVAAAYRISPGDVQAALLYAAELAKERIIPLGVGTE